MRKNLFTITLLLHLIVSTLVGMACLPPGSNGDAGVDAAQQVPCARFEARVDGRCQAVDVTGMQEREVSVQSGDYGLKGTLCLPLVDGDYQAPAAIIVHGSGPADRNGLSEGNLGYSYGREISVYGSLAQQLCAAGVVVLRYDKRWCFQEGNPACPNSIYAYPGGLAAVDALLLDDLVTDARAAVAFVAALPETRDDDVTVFGHSQGGLFVSTLVASEAKVSGGIFLASPSRSYIDSVAGQLENFADVLEQADAVRYADSINELRDDAASERQALEAIRAETYVGDSYDGIAVGWYLNAMQWHDAMHDNFITVDKPLLVLAGDADLNVLVDDYDLFVRWAAENAMNNVDSELLADHTHSFVPLNAQHNQLLEYQFSSTAVDVIVSWLKQSE